jgi:predicted PurR-regulated permease PerM
VSRDRSRRETSLRSTDEGSAGPRRTTTALVIVIGIVIFLYLVKSILIPFVFAGIVAYVCAPMVDRMEQRTGWPRWPFAVAVLVLLFGAVTLVGYYCIPSIMHGAVRVGSDLQGTVEMLARRPDRSVHGRRSA